MFGGAALVFLGAIGAYLALAGVDAWLRSRRQSGESGYRAAFLVALGIGLHNLGEGLAIGSAYAVGSLALGAALVVGFALHNTTEGLAIVAPAAREGKVSLRAPGRASGCWPARPPCWARGSAPRPFTRAWPGSCSASEPARSPR